MIRVSASALDSLYWYRRIDGMTTDDLVARLRGQVEPTEDMLAGIAWHRVLETARDGETLSGVVQEGRFTFEIDLPEPIILRLPQVSEVSGSKVLPLADGTDVEIRCRADGLSGNVVKEWKLTANPDVERYAGSMQWRAYLFAFDADAVSYVLFTKRNRGNRVFRIDEVVSFRLYKYQGLEDDLRASVQEFVDFCREHCPDVLERKKSYRNQENLPMETSQSLSLPELRIDIEGKVVATNLDEFRDRAVQVFNSINTDLQTDQDFEDAEASVKLCKNVEAKLKAAKEAALAQTASIEALFNSIDEIIKSARDKRLELEKLVKARKEERRNEILEQACETVREHYEFINRALPDVIQVPFVAVEFQQFAFEAMKNKRTIQSLMEAASQAVTSAILQANKRADRIRANYLVLHEIAGDRDFLFPDLAQILDQDAEDFKAAVQFRLDQYKRRNEPKCEPAPESIEQEHASTPSESNNLQHQLEPTASAGENQQKYLEIVARFRIPVWEPLTESEVFEMFKKKAQAAFGPYFTIEG